MYRLPMQLLQSEKFPWRVRSGRPYHFWEPMSKVNQKTLSKFCEVNYVPTSRTFAFKTPVALTSTPASFLPVLNQPSNMPFRGKRRFRSVSFLSWSSLRCFVTFAPFCGAFIEQDFHGRSRPALGGDRIISNPCPNSKTEIFKNSPWNQVEYVPGSLSLPSKTSSSKSWSNI